MIAQIHNKKEVDELISMLGENSLAKFLIKNDLTYDRNLYELKTDPVIGKATFMYTESYQEQLKSIQDQIGVEYDFDEIDEKLSQGYTLSNVTTHELYASVKDKLLQKEPKVICCEFTKGDETMTVLLDTSGKEIQQSLEHIQEINNRIKEIENERQKNTDALSRVTGYGKAFCNLVMCELRQYPELSKNAEKLGKELSKAVEFSAKTLSKFKKNVQETVQTADGSQNGEKTSSVNESIDPNVLHVLKKTDMLKELFKNDILSHTDSIENYRSYVNEKMPEAGTILHAAVMSDTVTPILELIAKEGTVEDMQVLLKESVLENDGQTGIKDCTELTAGAILHAVQAYIEDKDTHSLPINEHFPISDIKHIAERIENSKCFQTDEEREEAIEFYVDTLLVCSEREQNVQDLIGHLNKTITLLDAMNNMERMPELLQTLLYIPDEKQQHEYMDECIKQTMTQYISQAVKVLGTSDLDKELSDIRKELEISTGKKVDISFKRPETENGLMYPNAGNDFPQITLTIGKNTTVSVEASDSAFLSRLEEIDRKTVEFLLTKFEEKILVEQDIPILGNSGGPGYTFIKSQIPEEPVFQAQEPVIGIRPAGNEMNPEIQVSLSDISVDEAALDTAMLKYNSILLAQGIIDNKSDSLFFEYKDQLHTLIPAIEMKENEQGSFETRKGAVMLDAYMDKDAQTIHISGHRDVIDLNCLNIHNSNASKSLDAFIENTKDFMDDRGIAAKINETILYLRIPGTEDEPTLSQYNAVLNMLEETGETLSENTNAETIDIISNKYELPPETIDAIINALNGEDGNQQLENEIEQEAVQEAEEEEIEL